MSDEILRRRAAKLVEQFVAKCDREAARIDPKMEARYALFWQAVVQEVIIQADAEEAVKKQFFD